MNPLRFYIGFSSFCKKWCKRLESNHAPYYPFVALVVAPMTAMLVVGMLASAAFASPEQSPKTNFGPRKKKLTVALLKETYGKPFFHIEWEEEASETIYGENRKKFGKICFDEQIGFKIDDYLVTYYFAKDKFLARVIRGGPAAAEPVFIFS